MPGKVSQLQAWTEMSVFARPLGPSAEGAPSFTTTPMGSAWIMRTGEDGRAELSKMRWAFSKHGGAFKPDHMHARGETVDSLPRFCDAFGERRGILMAETFNV